MREVALDIRERVPTSVLVKPALPNLDIVAG